MHIVQQAPSACWVQLTGPMRVALIQNDISRTQLCDGVTDSDGPVVHLGRRHLLECAAGELESATSQLVGNRLGASGCSRTDQAPRPRSLPPQPRGGIASRAFDARQTEPDPNWVLSQHELAWAKDHRGQSPTAIAAIANHSNRRRSNPTKEALAMPVRPRTSRR